MKKCQGYCKIARSDWLQDFMNTVKTNDLSCMCLQLDNTVVFANIQTSASWKKINEITI